MFRIRMFHVGRARRYAGDPWMFTRAMSHRSRTLRIVVVGPVVVSIVSGR